jgi:hypothetical protein
MFNFMNTVKINLVVIFVVFSGVVIFINAQVLWDKTECGMTVNFIKEMYPKSFVPGDAEVFRKSENLLFLLAINDLKLIGRSFMVCFLFDEKRKLRKVRIQCAEKLTNEELIDLTASLSTSLKIKYGDQTSHQTEPCWEERWDVSKTTITLRYIYKIAVMIVYSGNESNKVEQIREAINEL